MRLVTWNCRVGGYRQKKAARMAALCPDVLTVQEVEPLPANGLFAGDSQPTFKDRYSDPLFPRRSIGVFSYTDTTLRAVDQADTLTGFRRFEASHHGAEFNVVAVWPWRTTSAATSYRQAHEGLERHAGWITKRDTVVLGDFNANASFKGPNWAELSKLLSDFGLVSAYHEAERQEPGKEKHPTHFHGGKADKPFHLDYCFIPETWLPSVRSVTVASYEDWRSMSDHVPLIVDLDR